MKVYSSPVEYVMPSVRGDGDIRDRFQKSEDAHAVALKVWMTEKGFTGQHSGKVYSTPRADGYANYMVAHAGRGTGLKTCLIHLPWGDAWHAPNIEYIPLKGILEQIKSREKIAEMFAS